MAADLNFEEQGHINKTLISAQEAVALSILFNYRPKLEGSGFFDVPTTSYSPLNHRFIGMFENYPRTACMMSC